MTRKRKSLTQTIKDLRKDYAALRDIFYKKFDEIRKLEDELVDLKKITPYSYFKVTYKMMANNKNVCNYCEVKHAASLEIAIKQIKLNTTYPDTFELVEVNKLG